MLLVRMAQQQATCFFIAHPMRRNSSRLHSYRLDCCAHICADAFVSLIRAANAFHRFPYSVLSIAFHERAFDHHVAFVGALLPVLNECPSHASENGREKSRDTEHVNFISTLSFTAAGARKLFSLRWKLPSPCYLLPTEFHFLIFISKKNLNFFWVDGKKNS